MPLKIKDKNYLDETVFQAMIFNEKNLITGVYLWIKDPDPQHWFLRGQYGETLIEMEKDNLAESSVLFLLYVSI